MRFVFNDSIIGMYVCTKLESVFTDSFNPKSFKCILKLHTNGRLGLDIRHPCYNKKKMTIFKDARLDYMYSLPQNKDHFGMRLFLIEFLISLFMLENKTLETSNKGRP